MLQNFNKAPHYPYKPHINEVSTVLDVPASPFISSLFPHNVRSKKRSTYLHLLDPRLQLTRDFRCPLPVLSWLTGRACTRTLFPPVYKCTRLTCSRLMSTPDTGPTGARPSAGEILICDGWTHLPSTIEQSSICILFFFAWTRHITP